jgi:hypothetical protein
MKILYKPFSILAGVIGGKLGQSVFKSIWAKLDHAQLPPSPKTEDAPVAKVVGAAALEAATMAAVGAAVDRASIRVFHHLTGIWPGEKHPQLQEEN